MNVPRPIVGISSGRLKDIPSPGAAFVGHRRSYSSFFTAAGGLPFYLSFPDEPTEELAQDMVSRIDALVLSGGEHVFPKAEDILHTFDHCSTRDEWELMLLNAALEQGKCIFGICRGMQLLVHRAGGNITQLSTLKHPGSHMSQGKPRSRWLKIPHRMALHPESALQAVIGDDKPLLLNSLHDQTCTSLGENDLGLLISAKCEDGAIEVVERSSDAQLILGVQGHPEALSYAILCGYKPRGLTEDEKLIANRAGLQWMDIATAFITFIKTNRPQ